MDVKLLFENYGMKEGGVTFAVSDENDISCESTTVDTAKEGFRGTAGLDANIKSFAVGEFICELCERFVLCIYYCIGTVFFGKVESVVKNICYNDFFAFLFRCEKGEKTDGTCTDNENGVTFLDYGTGNGML